MILTSIHCLAKLAAPALLVSFGALSSQAQDLPSPATPAPEQSAVPQNSPEALATAARNILELIEMHRFRMGRIDLALRYYGHIGDADHVRLFSLLRQREQSAYQQSLEAYRRMLGEQDFTRVATLLRNHLVNNQPEPTGTDEARAGGESDANAESGASAADRAERVRAFMAAQAEEERERATAKAALERSQAIARARASQRVQLAQRLQQARSDQLEARAAIARRYQPPTLPGAQGRPSTMGGYQGGAGSRGDATTTPSAAIPPAPRPAARAGRP
jgi:hypothetical protein